MTMDCQQQFDSLIDIYAAMPLYLPDVTTQQNCSEVIPAALDDTTGANCPVQQVLLGCFQVRRGQAARPSCMCVPHARQQQSAPMARSHASAGAASSLHQLYQALIEQHARILDMSASQLVGPARRLD